MQVIIIYTCYLNKYFVYIMIHVRTLLYFLKYISSLEAKRCDIKRILKEGFGYFIKTLRILDENKDQ
jgi:hypothetical protein